MSFALALLHICVLAALVCVGSAHTCPDTTSVAHSPTCPVQEHRHDVARQQLLQSLDRKAGRWNKKHARWQVLEALHAYDKYEKIVGAEIDRFETLYKHVPKQHRKILESTVHYKANFPHARTLLKTNAAFCTDVFHFSLAYYNISRHELAAFVHDTDDGKPKSALRTTLSQSLKHMVRDWSPDGQPERDATFPYIIDALATHLPPRPDTTYEVLVPGAGLGGLAHEISLLGSYISVTSNEWSTSMNMAYRYLTSLPPSHGPITLHPFLESWSHARTRPEITRPVTIQPPVRPSSTLLIEGDFTTKFLPHSTARYSAVATLFFIDTARNLIAYLETIHTLLRPGGIWVNVGPLLYGTAPLVQLTLEEIIVIAETMGFEFERVNLGAGEQMGSDDLDAWERSTLGGRVEQREVLYNFNATTLYKHGYVAQCWIARKKTDVDDDSGSGSGSGRVEGKFWNAGKEKKKAGEKEKGKEKVVVVGKGLFDRLKEKWL